MDAHYKGEMYLEKHRGAYTTHAKKWNCHKHIRKLPAYISFANSFFYAKW